MKLQTALENIEQLSSKWFNRDQKEVAKEILKKASNEQEIDQFYKLIINQIKLGFRFDESSIKPNGNISLLRESEILDGINLKQKDTIEHKLIIGENYDALKHLLITHKGLINIIYIDPPYNTEAAKSDGNNHLTGEEENIIKQKTSEGKSSFIYRDKYSRTGWLNMIKERLELSYDLLSDDGVIFISIDDNEQAYLKIIMDEIFGEENFISNIIWQKKNSGSGDDSSFLKILTEYVLFYSKNKNNLSVNKFFRNIEDGSYKLEDEFVEERGKYILNNLDRASLTWSESLDYEVDLEKISKELEVKFENNNKLYAGGDYEDYIHRKNGNHAQKDWQWRWSYEKLLRGIKNKFVVIKNNKIYSKQYQLVDSENNKIERSSPYNNFILNNEISGSSGTNQLRSIFINKVFDHPKPIELISHLISLISNNENSIILDFFAGSGTTGHSVMELNKQDDGKREFILVTNNENFIAQDITYERLYRIINGKGTKEEFDFDWIKKNKPYSNNSLRVFDLFIEKIGLNDKLVNLKDDLIEQYFKLNSKLSNDDLNLDNFYKKLSSLKQFEEDKNEIN